MNIQNFCGHHLSSLGGVHAGDVGDALHAAHRVGVADGGGCQGGALGSLGAFCNFELVAF